MQEKAAESNPILTLETYGKVLITGGYLILDSQFSGLVGSTTNIRMLFHLYETSEAGLLQVRVPQFDLSYSINPLQLKGLESQVNNHFIRASLLTTLSYPPCRENVQQYFSQSGLQVVIQASKYFYGYLDKIEKPFTIEKLQSIPEFVHFQGFGKKTGMGSSSALITGLTSILLLQFEKIKLTSAVIHLKSIDEKVKAELEILCQLANSRASGKIGSGFDIAASIYGTHLY